LYLYAEVTGQHVYSVQKAPVGSNADAEHLNALCAEGAKQTDALFDAPLVGAVHVQCSIP
jgi:hypothetical protein